MLKVRRLMLIVMVICTIFSVSIAETYIVGPASGVNLRDSRHGGNVIQVVRHGTQVDVTGEDRYWYEVTLDDGTTGYIYKDYLHQAQESELIPQPERRKITREADAKFIGSVLYDSKIYKTANGRVLGSMEVGSFVYILQVGKYWHKIVWNNNEVAYIQASSCEIVDVNIPGEGILYKLEDEYTPYFQVPIRKEPNSTARRLLYAKNGSYVRVVDEVDDKWVLVCYDGYGNLGYVAKMYLRTVKKYN